MTIKEIKKAIDGVFLPPKRRIYIGNLYYGTPYYYPIGFNPNIIRIKRIYKRDNPESNKPRDLYRNLPMVRRCKYWIKTIFGKTYYIEIGFPISIKTIELGWKEKYGDPRFEWCPSFQINFFHLQLHIYWTAPIINEACNNDLYYEMILTYIKHKSDAEANWGWIDYNTKRSTWCKDYIISK